MAITDEPLFCSFEDLPASNPACEGAAHQRIMRRHVLATLQSGAEQSCDSNLQAVEVSTLLRYLQSIGYDVDETWLIRAAVEALPDRRAQNS